MNRIVKIYQTGGPEVLVLEDSPMPSIGKGEVLIRNTAIGVNLLETYFRSGLYPTPLPATLGNDSVGAVEKVGDDVHGVEPGDRVLCIAGIMDAYADYRVGKIDKVLKLPSSIADVEAAALLVKGMTAQFLVRRTARIQPGDHVLFHAAAGGVGSIACQWLKSMGAIVIGGVGSPDKEAAARDNGCDHVVMTSDPNFSQQVRSIVKEGVAVVFDSVGKDTFHQSLNTLRSLGLMVSFGNASGKPPPLDFATLAEKGSLYITRPGIRDYISNKTQMEQAASELFDLHAAGVLRVPIRHTYKLEDVANAHRDLEGRRTTGPVVLTP